MRKYFISVIFMYTRISRQRRWRRPSPPLIPLMLLLLHHAATSCSEQFEPSLILLKKLEMKRQPNEIKRIPHQQKKTLRVKVETASNLKSHRTHYRSFSFSERETNLKRNLKQKHHQKSQF